MDSIHPSFCPHEGCPGCPLGIQEYLTQIEKKRKLVEDFFTDAFNGALPAVVEPVVPSAKVLGYRAGSKLVISLTGKKVRIGLYRRNSHRVVDIPRCPIHHPLINEAAGALRKLLAKVPMLIGESGRGWIRYCCFQVSEAEGKLLVTLVTRTNEHKGILASLSARLAEAVPEVVGVMRNVNDSSGNEILGHVYEPVRSEDRIVDRFGRVSLVGLAGGFLQTNRGQAARAYAEGVEALGIVEKDFAFDLYCGAGGYAYELARYARGVVGVEQNPRGIEAARDGLQLNGSPNIKFVVGSVEDELVSLSGKTAEPNIVAMNPARKGIEPSVAAWLKSVRPRGVLYLSCDPKSASRDAVRICEGGVFSLAMIRPYDFFPQTGHVETMMLLRASG